MKTFTKVLTGLIQFCFLSGTYRRRFFTVALAAPFTLIPSKDINTIASLICVFQIGMMVWSIPGWIRVKSFEARMNQITESSLPPDVKADLRKTLIDQFQKEQQAQTWWEMFKEKATSPREDPW